MKNTQDDVAAVWRCIAEKVKGRGKILSEKEVEIKVIHGKRSREVVIILEPGISKAVELMVINETRKLTAKHDGKHHLLRYLAFCGGVEFRPQRILIADQELFYALGYIFQQTLRKIKKERIDEEKDAILPRAEAMVSKFPRKRVTSIFYGGGLFNIKINGDKHPAASGVDSKEVLINLKKKLAEKS